jgi:ubiquinone biosynthesis protein COQ9
MSKSKDSAIEQARREKAAQRDAIIMSALSHVPFDGWSEKTLATAAENTGANAGAVRRFFPGGVKSAVAHFTDLADRLMLEDLKAYDLPSLKVRERVTIGVKVRLVRWAPHREAIRRALALAQLPPFAGGALRGWYKTVDAIWRAAGDQSADFNFYTKRGLLAAVYGSTLLYWLDDKSEDCAATWAFLDRRIADVMKVPQIKGRIAERLKKLPSPRSIFDRFAQRRSPGFR